MKFLRELHNVNKAADELLKQIKFSSYPEETEMIRLRLIKLGIQPSLGNIKKFMVSQLLRPIDEVPEAIRRIILRSGRVESDKGGRVFRPEQAI